MKSDSDYTGRVEYRSNQKDCTLRITELRESDSAVYKFRFITNQQGGSYTGSPGVTLIVTDLQVQVITSQHGQDGTLVQLKCHSSCLHDRPSYVWMKNGQVTLRETSSTLRYSFFPEDNISCALKGHEEFPSPSVYDPKPPSVSVSPSGEITEGSSVTLTCSSEANPAATYVWYKRNSQPLSKNSQLIFSSIQSSDSGEYYCSAVNKLGSKRKSITIDVKCKSNNFDKNVLYVCMCIYVCVCVCMCPEFNRSWRRRGIRMSDGAFYFSANSSYEFPSSSTVQHWSLNLPLESRELRHTCAL
uniref:B-cell receptor CD22 n=1 Tax=Oreochromis niloticus TaxID=8128 RepID=A0A669EDJ7_ORENI